ncbi:neurogenic locus notch homolog protein 1-like [Mytilus californianus]|uniref:neurogenic locus notch homolog protein 1-like n=1 Tax=Mytilus californianus TaxID=6549 RepID=UPI002245289B|nr:neurogenic locus notch homolog protein 1-like [Mytilus californianus]
MLKVFVKMIYMKIPLILCSIPTMIFGFNIIGGNFHKNKHMDSHVIIAKDKIGPKLCVKDCTLYKGCNGVNYIRDGLTCELLSISYPDDKLVYGNGIYFTNITEWTQEVNRCYPNPCQEKTYCVEACYNQYVCVTFDVPCDSYPCINSGTCRNGVNRYTCICPSGYYGTTCQYTPCTNRQCSNGGHCIISGSGWYCSCPSGYYGTYCQYDPCSIGCSNGGSCEIVGSRAKCCVSSIWGSDKCGYRCET